MMREFFKGWRRKAGCIALAMAVFFTVSCVRSYFSHDGVAFPMFPGSIRFTRGRERLGCCRTIHWEGPGPTLGVMRLRRMWNSILELCGFVSGNPSDVCTLVDRPPPHPALRVPDPLSTTQTNGTTSCVSSSKVGDGKWAASRS